MNEGLEIYYKTFKRGIGVLLALAVAVYMAVVTIEGGVMNWDRPKTETEIRSGFIKFAIRDAAAKQNPNDLFVEAANRFNEDRGNERLYREAIENHVKERVEEQKAYVSKKKPLPEGVTQAVGETLQDALGGALANVGVRLSQADEKIALSAENSTYEIMLGSKLPVDSLFTAYLGKLHTEDWYVDEAFIDRKHTVATLTAYKDKSRVRIAILSKAHLPQYPTFVLMTSEPFQGEDAGDGNKGRKGRGEGEGDRTAKAR